MFILDPRFPLDDVETIGSYLTASGGLVVGANPADADMPSVAALLFDRDVEQLSTIILPDRNLVSRMARVAREGVKRPLDGPMQMAANVMAFAQAMGIQIEPSIAFHELAFSRGNLVAHEELAWFRAANRDQAGAWIDIAMGRADRLRISEPAPIGMEDLAFPLERWRRNYLVVLKLAELELSELAPVERVMRLLNWMAQDFIVAGPAAVFSSMYLSPNAARSGMLKSLRSEHRRKAIEGIRNAAWDVTHLSDFVRRCLVSDVEKTRNIFATADMTLAQIAPILLVGEDVNCLESALSKPLLKWWPSADAAQIASKISEYVTLASNRPAPRFESDNSIGNWITEAESRVLSWTRL